MLQFKVKEWTYKIKSKTENATICIPGRNEAMKGTTIVIW